ncbi:HesA/MoeB/ThiF family protein, partial [Cellulosilyticum ruminicola]|uniref:HesA/MoeB/ThiF family protein n=1 Tax=Cellulosilyticum ruminicola TaxID=425254 RepID=UPI0009F9C125
MERYYLNFFVPILKGDRGYEFIQSNILGTNTEKTLEFNKQQEEIFKQMIDGQGFELQEFKGIFGEENITEWLKNRFLIPVAIEQKGIYSRNQAFYWRSNMGNVQQVLGKSTVMVLGCGGIGTHVSWNMAVLGVKNIIIVDFDKVEESNLNRQILYDIQDIGEYKVDVLKKKLQHINPLVQVTALNRKINSLEDLEAIIKQYDTDCIVKTLDTPFVFTKWLDAVCHKYNRKYIAGIMMNTHGAIGTTYIPHQSLGYSYFVNMPVNKEKVSGIMPSLGFIMYQLGTLVSEEVFKILTNKGKLKYVNKIK